MDEQIERARRADSEQRAREAEGVERQRQAAALEAERVAEEQQNLELIMAGFATLVTLLTAAKVPTDTKITRFKRGWSHSVQGWSTLVIGRDGRLWSAFGGRLTPIRPNSEGTMLTRHGLTGGSAYEWSPISNRASAERILGILGAHPELDWPAGGPDLSKLLS